MKFKKPHFQWIICGTFAVTTAIGYQFGLDAAENPHPQKSGPPPLGKSRSAGSRDAGDRDAPRSTKRDRGNNPEIPKISIDLKTVSALLKNGNLSRATFEESEETMDEALTLLGCTDDERAAVMAALEQAKDEFHAAEKANLKPEVRNNKVHFDMRPMDGPSKEIIQRMKEGIENCLPKEKSDALTSAIPWQDFYFGSPTDNPEVAPEMLLSIESNPTGELFAQQNHIKKSRTFSTGSGIGRLIVQSFPEGEPIPADQVFPERWKPFLQGISLLPTKSGTP